MRLIDINKDNWQEIILLTTDKEVRHMLGEKYYELCRFMIDRKYQGKGYGKEALQLIINDMKNEFHCNEIYLSVDPENVKAKHIYQQFGFYSTGKVVDEEEVYKLAK